MLDKEDVRYVLDQKLRQTGYMFDDELIDAIFNNLTTDQDGHIHIDEFCHGYVEVENYFTETIATCDFKIMELENINKEQELQLREAANTEVTNQYGIMESSILTLTLVEGRLVTNIDYKGTSDLYAIIECAGQTKTSRHLENMQNPVWDDNFQFSIFNGKETIKITVMDRNMMRNDNVIGNLNIPIETLKDQVKLEDWFQLEPPRGNSSSNSKGRIRLQLWWVHSKTKLIEDRMEKIVEDIAKIKDDKIYYQNKVRQLRQPFGWHETESTIDVKPKAAARKYEIEQEFVDSDEEEQLTAVAKFANTITERERIWARDFEEFSDEIMQKIGFDYTPWFKLMVAINFLYGLLTIIICI
jgi:hypothetical protein